MFEFDRFIRSEAHRSWPHFLVHVIATSRDPMAFVVSEQRTGIIRANQWEVRIGLDYYKILVHRAVCAGFRLISTGPSKGEQ